MPKTNKAHKRAVSKAKNVHKTAHKLHSKVSKKVAAARKKGSAKIMIKPKAVKAKSVKIPKQTKEEKRKLEEKMLQELELEEMKKTKDLVEHRGFLDHVEKNVGSGAADILRQLVKNARTDEDLAAQLNYKVNDVRRMLNIMNGYSIVRYDVNKDSKGWLIFKWRIDREKLSEYIGSMQTGVATKEHVLPGNCNDFFICKKCYPSEKVVLPFDTAFESEFSCNGCGKPFAILNRQETEALFKQVTN